MATRHQVRQAVVSLLYARDINGENDEFKDEFLESKKIRNKQKIFTEELINGILSNLNTLDDVLNEHSCKRDGKWYLTKICKWSFG